MANKDLGSWPFSVHIALTLHWRTTLNSLTKPCCPRQHQHTHPHQKRCFFFRFKWSLQCFWSHLSTFKKPSLRNPQFDHAIFFPPTCCQLQNKCSQKAVLLALLDSCRDWLSVQLAVYGERYSRELKRQKEADSHVWLCTQKTSW